MVRPESSLEDVTSLFRQWHIHQLPVVDAKGLVGIVSDRDVRRSLAWSRIKDAGAEQARAVAAVGSVFDVRDIMQTDVISTCRSADLRSALRLMLQNRIHALPVLDNGAICGIITETDFIRAIAQNDLL